MVKNINLYKIFSTKNSIYQKSIIIFPNSFFYQNNIALEKKWIYNVTVYNNIRFRQVKK